MLLLKRLVAFVVTSVALFAGGAAAYAANEATGQPHPWQLGLQAPATPVMDNPKSVPARLRMPSAIASATGALTAPCSSNNIGSTPKVRVLASLAYATTPSMKYFDEPGTSVNRCASKPPVQLSATDNV